MPFQNEHDKYKRERDQSQTITARELAMWIFCEKENRIGQGCVYIV